MDSSAAKTAKKYCLIAGLSAWLLLSCVLAFNTAVDPYGMYRLIEVKGFNLHKPAIYHRTRLFKAYDVRRIKPSAIVLGTSRSHVGLRMSHEGWDPTATPRYNLAFDGATTKEMYFYLRHADAIHPIRQVVLGLDIYQPTLAPSSPRPDFDPELLFETRSLISRLRVTLADLKILSSIDTLTASVKTLWSQNDGEPEWFAADGQRLGEVFFRRYEEDFQRSPRAYFDEIDRLEVGFKLDDSGQVPLKRASHSPGPKIKADETSLGYIQRIIEFCRTRRIDLRIFITPEHAHQMEISAAVGAWHSIEKAKRDLVRLLSEDTAKHPGEPPVPLYDFSGYNSITTESLPEPGSLEEMKYYWDSSHFKEIVGDFVLDRLFGIDRPKRPVPGGFGLRLNDDTIGSAIAGMRAGQIAYRRSHPQDIAGIRSSVDSVLQKTDRQINPAHSPCWPDCGCAARFGEEPWAMQKAISFSPETHLSSTASFRSSLYKPC